jgi:uncharacterized protein YegL
MRRLPVYLLIDVSGSMMGEPITAVENGVSMLVTALRSEPQALETAYLSVITFDNTARQLVPLTDLTSFQEPHLEASGATYLGAALELLAKKLDTEVIKTTFEEKGDWKPLVFIMTDGQPNDDWKKGADIVKMRKPTIVACAAGFEANTRILKQITDNVVQLGSTSAPDIAAFFKWVTASISTGSQRVNVSSEEDSGDLGALPPPPPELSVVV